MRGIIPGSLADEIDLLAPARRTIGVKEVVEPVLWIGGALTKYLVVIEKLETYSLRKAAENSPFTAKCLNLRARDGTLDAYKLGRNWRVIDLKIVDPVLASKE